MPYLIDGYNLLHALGALKNRAGPGGLEQSRLRLLGLLRGAYGDAAGEVTVVFDAAGARSGAASAFDYHGIHVRFAVAEGQADDLIEELILRSAAPRQLHVVSDDRRLQQAAQRRQCLAVGCLDFLEQLDRRRHRPDRPRRSARTRPTEKTAPLAPQELQGWLDEFSHLEEDPALEEFFRPYGFEDELSDD